MLYVSFGCVRLLTWHESPGKVLFRLTNNHNLLLLLMLSCALSLRQFWLKENHSTPARHNPLVLVMSIT
jgi:hypothetical protein